MNPRHHVRPSRFDRDPARLVAGGAQTEDERRMGALLSGLPSALPEDSAVERVWRRLASPATRDTTLPKWWILAPAVAGLLAVLAWLPSLRSAPAPAAVELVRSSGGVFSSTASADWHPRLSGEGLSEGERVRTDATGQALLRVPRIAAILVGSHSDAAVEELGHGTFVRLSRGTLTARVSKRTPGDPFVVRTARYTITVVGTLFTVEEGPGAHTAVSVREGVVEVSDSPAGLLEDAPKPPGPSGDTRKPPGHVYRVTAGTRWASEDAEARGADRTPDAVKTLLESGLQGRSSAELPGDLVTPPRVPEPVRADPPTAVAAVPAPPEHPPPSLVSTGELPARAAPPARPLAAPEVVSPGPKDVVPTAPPTIPPPLPAAPAAVEPAPVAEPTASAPVAAPPAPVAGATPDDGAYAKGVALEAKGDFEGAAQALARAASSDGHRRDLALYSLGRLAQRRLHDPRRALEAFRRYRVEYPQGALLPEVDFAMLQIEVEGNHPAEALTESTRFLTTHPTSDRAEKVHLLRGNLLRDAGRCGEALADYAAIRGADADDAVYSTAYCQRKQGDRSAAAATLRDYLKRFPGGAHRSEAEKALESENDSEKKY